MLDGVLAKLADRHQDRIPDNCRIIEVVDKRLDHRVGEEVNFRQLHEPGRSNDHVGIVLGEGFANPTDRTPKAKRSKEATRRLVAWLFDGNPSSAVFLAIDPKGEPDGKQRVQSAQAACVQNNLVLAAIDIEPNGTAVFLHPCPT